MKFASTLLLSAFMATAYGRDNATEFIPEASAVCKIGDSLIIGGDEEPQSLWIFHPQSEKIEKMSVNGAKWDDLEGLATVTPKNFFGITSHSRTKKGKRKTEREQLILFNINGNKIERKNSWSLRDQIFSQLKKSHDHLLDLKVAESATPDDGGLNIEGLAHHEGKLYLGLRSPLTTKGDAIIIVIKNANALITTGEDPILDEVMTVPLSGKGIRSLDSLPQGLLILSGSHDDRENSFGLAQLFTRTGTLQNFNLLGFEQLIRPEGVVGDEIGGATFVQDFKAPEIQDIIIHLKPNQI